MTVEEIWKDVQGYEGEYQVSNLGRVKSLDKTVYVKNNNTAVKHGKVLKARECQGYYYVCLSSKNIKKMCRVHILVAKAFVQNFKNKKTVNHINGNKLDNRAENLEWLSIKENLVHAWNNGLNKRGKPREIYQYDLEGKCVAKYESAKEASRKTGIDHANICRVASSSKYYHTAGGYSWKWSKSLSEMPKKRMVVNKNGC